MDTAFKHLNATHKDGVAYVKLDRKEKRNAINDVLIGEIAEFFSAVPAETRAVILHAEGDHFCAGLDLVERMEKASPDPLIGIRHSRNWYAAFDRIQFGEVPVISVLKGGVIGGGLELAAATHIRICEASTYFQLPEGQRGIFVGGGGSVRIPHIIGPGRVIELMLTGRKIPVEEGQALGLAHHVVPDGSGLQKAEEIALQIISNSPMSNFAIINGIGNIAEMGSKNGFFAESILTSVTARASNSKERIDTFFKGRKDRQQSAE
ncbi:MAG: crotonase/enoyl-CoA hydratase family protein [Alphaproteobacteria bacterium]|nr:crotonase/enoyl-CoA hydratase family protein [Alphaproteobacteria bacterium]